MKKVIIAIVVVIILAVGGILIFGSSSKPASNSTSQNNVAAVNDGIVLTKTNSSVGQYLTNPDGRTLYTYNADTSGVSNCTGSCLVAWPAYQDTGSTTGLPAGISTIKRTDNGQTQYTYNGLPLYFFASESAGQVTGNGVQNFTVAKPASTTSSSSTTATPSTSSSTSSSSSNYPY
jgi:predicted lipoprotein with Yx(FWY)xxD motif